MLSENNTSFNKKYKTMQNIQTMNNNLHSCQLHYNNDNNQWPLFRAHGQKTRPFRAISESKIIVFTIHK